MRRFALAAPLALLACLTLVGCASQKWYPGSEHPVQPHVVAGEKDGTWLPAPGYAWDGPESESVTWCPGVRNPTAPGLMAGYPEHSWVPAPGWAYAHPQMKKSFEVVWQPGTPHPDYPHVVAASEPDQWEPAQGFEWFSDSDGDFRVKRK